MLSSHLSSHISFIACLAERSQDGAGIPYRRNYSLTPVVFEALLEAVYAILTARNVANCCIYRQTLAQTSMRDCPGRLEPFLMRHARTSSIVSDAALVTNLLPWQCPLFLTAYAWRFMTAVELDYCNKDAK